MNTDEELFARKCELQRQVLQSWERLQLAKQAHDRLLNELQSVRWQLEQSPLIEELFSELS